jgi:hypothetical protein
MLQLHRHHRLLARVHIGVHRSRRIRRQLISDLWLMTAPAVSLKTDELEKDLTVFRAVVANDADIEQRFTLMSKLFARAIAIEPGEERFLWLWKVLEVFPMRDTSNIKPISE